MSKYSEIRDSIFSKITNFTDLSFYPDNFGELKANTARVSIVLSDSTIHETVYGLLIIDIFITAGEGPSKLYSIADELDTLLLKKTVGHLQFFTSAMTPRGYDIDNPTLFRGQYQLNFSYFKVNN
jgi:hypothetical protein